MVERLFVFKNVGEILAEVVDNAMEDIFGGESTSSDDNSPVHFKRSVRRKLFSDSEDQESNTRVKDNMKRIDTDDSEEEVAMKVNLKRKWCEDYDLTKGGQRKVKKRKMNNDGDKPDEIIGVQLEKTKGDRSEKLKGDRSEKIKGDRSEKIKGDISEKMKGDRSENTKVDRSENTKRERRSEKTKGERRPEKTKGERSEETKGERPEKTIWDKPEKTKRDKPEKIKRDKLEKTKGVKSENTKGDQYENKKEDNVNNNMKQFNPGTRYVVVRNSKLNKENMHYFTAMLERFSSYSLVGGEDRQGNCC